MVDNVLRFLFYDVEVLESVLSNRDLWEQPLLDLWAVPHFLSGVLIAAAFILLARSLVSGFFFAGFIAVAWELFEHATGISTVEATSNIIADVIVLLVGFAVLVPFRSLLSDERGQWLVGSVSVAHVATTLLGWLSYQQYAV